MSHVLLSGDPHRYPGLRALLTGWGMTVGLLAGRGQASLPGPGECDLVIHVYPLSADPGAMPDGALDAGGAARVAAPLLVIGGPTEVTGAFASVPDPGPQGILLRAALAEGLGLARRSRENQGEDPRREHLQFLGHELRSPLAAIKTALDVLSRGDGFDPGSARMLQIAVRNIDRLTATVEWSQDLREFAESPPKVRLEEVSLAEVVRRLGQEGHELPVLTDPSRHVLTDPELLTRLVGQLGRVMDSAYPEVGRRLVLEPAENGEGVRLAWLVGGEIRPVAGLQSGGPAGPGNPAEQDDTTIRRLIDVMVAPYLREVLGAHPRPLESCSGLRGVGFDLPLPLPVTAS